ncbi:MAG: type IV pilus secretin PilQ [Pasteurellaceae bacterium]|nr:type IV pilus secretin PilQ [Pasteurellaceae bacterium]
MRYIYLSLLISLTAFSTPISISLKDAPTKEILSYLAEEHQQNILIVENIQSLTTLRLENSHFDEVIQSIAKINQLSAKQDNGIYSIQHKSTETQKENNAKIAIKDPIAQIKNITPAPPKLVSKTIKLYYAKASEVIESITKGNGNLLSENGYLHFDDRSNQIIIKDSPNSVKNLTSLIKQLDAPTEQIAIEARIVTISSDNLKELGVRWGVFSPNEQHHRFGGRLEGNGSATNNLNVNFPVLSNAASAVLQIATINSRVLDLELSALEQENSVEIIASPRLLTTNKKAASIKQGAEIPYAVYNKKSDSFDFEFKEAVLGLDVTPHLSEQNQILMDLVVTQNSPNNQNGVNGLTTIDKQELKTQVFAKHGETIVLGGVFQHLTAKGEDKVPILGSIPVIKHLFSQSRDKIAKRELVIFVTPYIVKSSPIVPPESAKKAKSTQKSRQK